MKHLFAIAALVCAAGCDPAATASGEGSGLGDEQRSQLGESCSTSLHCATDLRCLDQICRSAKTSTLGEFYYAAGNTAMADKDVDRAIEAYTQAVNQYEADKVEPPAEAYCALGHALVQDRDDRTRAERAARALHRCVLGAPAGSALRDNAMRNLSLLLEVGLDPLLLARTELADAYLTKVPALPNVEDLKVTGVAVGRAPRSRTYTAWVEALAAPAVKQALAPCWTAYSKETREDTMSVVLSFKYGYRLDDYDDFDRSTLTIEEVTGTDAKAKAAQCVRAALVPIADEYSKRGGEASWKIDMTVTMGK